MKQKKPILQLLVGVEGSGHHMILAFLEHFFKTQKAIRNGEWYLYLFNRWDALKVEQRATPLVLNSQEELKPEIARIIKRYSTKVDFFYSSASFPYGVKRDTLRRPDIIDMVEVLAEHIDIRPLVIHRDPISCTYSAVRREFTDNLLLQARYVEDNLIYIKQQLEATEISYRTLNYEDFVSDPSKYEEGLKKWWGLNDESFKQGLKQIRPGTTKSKIPSQTLSQLEEFFSPMRRRQWDNFLTQKDIADIK